MSSFLAVPTTTPDAQRLYDDDLEHYGFVMNASRLWAHQPSVHHQLFDLLGQLAQVGSLTVRDRGVLVSACASALGDSYCALAWGSRLADEAGAEAAGGVLRGEDAGLDDREQALASWARQVVREPNGTTADDVEALHEAGYDDAQVLAITMFVALRLAFSSVNDALGARPDRELVERAPALVADAVTFGRRPMET